MIKESSVVRTPKPDSIKYRIGQVVKHKKYDLYGVIIGWDETANVIINIYLNLLFYIYFIETKTSCFDC
jgi:hypothetical protein